MVKREDVQWSCSFCWKRQCAVMGNRYICVLCASRSFPLTQGSFCLKSFLPFNSSSFINESGPTQPQGPLIKELLRQTLSLVVYLSYDASHDAWGNEWHSTVCDVDRRDPARDCRDQEEGKGGMGQTRIKQLAYFGLGLIMGVIYLSFDSLYDDVQLIIYELISSAFKF